MPPARLEEVAHHYEEIGGRSPLNKLTFRQAAALEVACGLPVHVGMRNWAPYIADTLARMADAGVRRAVGVVLSPHANEASRERYVDAVEAGRAALGSRAPEIAWVGEWHRHPRFVAAIGARIREAAGDVLGRARLVFTAHSVPVATAGPYVTQLEETAAAVAASLRSAGWLLAYQSRSGPPHEPWLEPDVNDVLRELARAGVRDVVIAPIGFVCDHVEVLYDLDVEARATAEAAGIRLVRAATVNDHPEFVAMLTELVRGAAT